MYANGTNSTTDAAASAARCVPKSASANRGRFGPDVNMPEDDQWGARATRDRMHDGLCSTCRIKGGKPTCTAHTARRSYPAPNKPPVVPSPLSLAPSRDPDRHTDAIRDEVRFAANRRDPDAAVREVLDTALPEVGGLAVTVERRAQVEQDGRPPHGQ